VRGSFITFEGGEGAGKSTQVRRLADRLAASGRRVVTTREPGGSPRAEAIREILLSGRARPLGALGEAYLFSAARIDHLAEVIEPALAAGSDVLCDRFADSMRAYQGAAGGLDVATIDALERAAVGDRQPDLTLILDLPATVGLARVARRHEGGADRFEADTLAIHEARRAAFLAIAGEHPERCVVIDANRDADAVAADVWRAVAGRLGLREAGHGR
jgi:dTMP kinase